MSGVHAVGIDLGTTYSCLSYLTRQGEPVTLPNAEGELSTPSVVFFDGDEVVVGTEALRNAVVQPDRVVQNAKRFMGDPRKSWIIDGKVYRPADISALILKKMLKSAEQQLGPIRHAVVTVPAQFSDIQRQDTIEAAHKSGLDRVDLINEPVAAALCHVLGTEGMWFSELAGEQKIMVYDLGGGTFDLSLVSYTQHTVNVVASAGDLHLGGIDWNAALEKHACELFTREVPDDPRMDRHSMQALANDVEQCKRSLSVRPRAAVTVVHAGRHKSYPITQEQFETLTAPLVRRTEQITIELVKDHARRVTGQTRRTAFTDDRPGWQTIDAVLVTGGASRMPMVRKMLQRISGTTLNTSLSPDQSISHGASYYAGMLLSNMKFAQSLLSQDAQARLSKMRQRSVNARALGVLVRDPVTGKRIPHYLLPANTPLPCEFREIYGTIIPQQKRVHVHIVESGTASDDDPVHLGACVINELPVDLPAGSPIEVTISYDEQARVHVAARDVASGQIARTEIVRKENLVQMSDSPQATDIALVDAGDESGARASQAGAMAHELQSTSSVPGRAVTTDRRATTSVAPQAPGPPAKPNRSVAGARRLEKAERPVPLCNRCGEPLSARGLCPQCGGQPPAPPRRRRTVTGGQSRATGETRIQSSATVPKKSSPPASGPQRRRAAAGPVELPPLKEDEVLELVDPNAKTEPMAIPPVKKAASSSIKRTRRAAQQPREQTGSSDQLALGENEFWDIVE